jgi:hypothetical protein
MVSLHYQVECWHLLRRRSSFVVWLVWTTGVFLVINVRFRKSVVFLIYFFNHNL